MSVKTVTIHDDLTVSPDPVEVSRDGGDVVAWNHEKGLDFDVDFGGQGAGPFANHRFNKGSQTGSVRREVGIGSRHKYTVTVGGRVLDPIIIVK